MREPSHKEKAGQRLIIQATTKVCACKRGPHWHLQEPICGKCGGIWFTPLSIFFEHSNGHRGDLASDAWLERIGMHRRVSPPQVTLAIDLGKALLVELEDANSDKIQDTMRSLAAVIRRWNPDAADALESPIAPLKR